LEYVVLADSVCIFDACVVTGEYFLLWNDKPEMRSGSERKGIDRENRDLEIKNGTGRSMMLQPGEQIDSSS